MPYACFFTEVVGLQALSGESLVRDNGPKRNFVACQNVRCKNASNECAKAGF